MHEDIYVSIAALVIIGVITIPFALFFIMNKINSKKKFKTYIEPDLSSTD